MSDPISKQASWPKLKKPSSSGNPAWGQAFEVETGVEKWDTQHSTTFDALSIYALVQRTLAANDQIAAIRTAEKSDHHEIELEKVKYQLRQLTEVVDDLKRQVGDLVLASSGMPAADAPDAVWAQENERLLTSYRGRYVAVDPKAGIVAADIDLENVIKAVRSSAYADATIRFIESDTIE